MKVLGTMQGEGCIAAAVGELSLGQHLPPLSLTFQVRPQHSATCMDGHAYMHAYVRAYMHAHLRGHNLTSSSRAYLGWRLWSFTGVPSMRTCSCPRFTNAMKSIFGSMMYECPISFPAV